MITLGRLAGGSADRSADGNGHGSRGKRPRS